MLDFLKKLLNKPQKQEEILEIDIDKIEEWLNIHTDNALEEVDKQINAIYANIEEDIKSGKERLSQLESAKLRNEDIPLRAKQIMEGNRNAYIQAVTQFLESLDTGNKGFFSGKSFCKEFDEKINELNKQTMKSFFVMKEFMADEVSKVASSLKQLDDYVKDMKEIIRASPVYNVDEVRSALHAFKEKQKAISDIDSQIKEKRKELEEHNSARGKVEKIIVNIKKSDEYHEYKKLIDQRDRIVESVKEIEDELSADFSVLSKPLKKYARVAVNEKLVERYASSPILAILEDQKLEIAGTLDELKAHIADEKVELKDKQKDKAMQIIGKLSRQYLESAQAKHKSLKASKKEIDTKVLSNPVHQNYNDMLYKQEHYLNRCRHTIEDINSLEKSHVKLNTDEVKKMLEEKCSIMASKKVVIIEKAEKNEDMKTQNPNEDEKKSVEHGDNLQ